MATRVTITPGGTADDRLDALADRLAALPANATGAQVRDALRAVGESVKSRRPAR